MWNLIKNELIKLHYKRKLLITAIVLMVIAVLLCCGTFAVSKLAKSVSTPKGQIKLFETNISNLEKQKSMNKKLSTTTKSDNWQATLETKISIR